MFKHQDELVEAAIWGFSDWATAVDTQFGRRRRWYRQKNLGGWVDETGTHWVCDVSSDPMCTKDVSKDHEKWAQEITHRAMRGFQEEKESGISPQEEEKRLQILRSLGYIDD